MGVRAHRDLQNATSPSYIICLGNRPRRRYAARGHYDVGARRGLAERCFELLRIVAHDPEVDHLAAEACEHAPEGVAVGVVDFAGLEFLSDRDELVARGEECDLQLAPHAHFADAQ
jgi:hypothetical protein